MDLRSAWAQIQIRMLLVTLLSVLVFFDTWVSIVDIWERSDTYTHGFVIAPISLWLIWTRREQYQQIYPQFSVWALALVALTGFMWLLSDLISILVLKQLALVCLLLAGFWVVLGTQLVLSMLFPLCFLFFMVPMGEELIPPLMEFTATFTVAMLRLTGISVFREGLHFTLVSGNWSVVQACSGISYLIASTALGTIYAYLTYTRYWKRTLFILLSVIVPVIANGLRAYMIVMIGHLSDMQLATGVDHLVYGGLFFGLVMLILFFIGSFWRDEEPGKKLDIQHPCFSVTENLAIGYQQYSVVALLCLFFIAWPVSANWLKNQVPENAELLSFQGLSAHGWELLDVQNWGWQPKLQGAANEQLNYLQKGDARVALYQANFGREHQGAELVNSQHILLDKAQSESWKLISVTKKDVVLAQGENFSLVQSILKGNGRALLVWRWYKVGSYNTNNDYYAKGLQLLKRLTANTDPELQIMLFTEAPLDEYQQAQIDLQLFISDWQSN